MAKTATRVDMLGTSFSISADESSEYLHRLLSKYRNTVEQVRSSTGIEDSLKLAIISGIVLCDELEKLAMLEAPENRKAEQLAIDMITKLDRLLDDYLD